MDLAGLARIERELARTGLRLRFPDHALERQYQLGQRESARLHNRITTALLVVVFDLFIIPETVVMPEAVFVSAVLRFAVLTPAAALFVLLDWRGVVARWNAVLVSLLLVAPTFISCLESLKVTNPLAITDFQFTPLLQLAVLTSRVSVGQALVVNVVCGLLFSAIVLTSPIVPVTSVSSMLLFDVAIGISTLVFAWRIDVRDRQIFLFTQQAIIGRELLASQNRMLKKMTQVDALTGLGNRRCFDETLAGLWAGAVMPAPVTLVMFDIDCFKQFNDRLGHQAGDECLMALARAVTRCLRDAHDVLVRYGGEEFAIVLPRTSLEEGAAIAERLRLAVLDHALPHPGGGPLHLVTVSLGVASVLAPVQTVSSLIEAADQCLYAAKRLGRNRVATPGSVVALENAAGDGVWVRSGGPSAEV